MSKTDKLENRLFRNPKPKDFRWEELLRVMRKNDFEEFCQGGSHYTFQHKSGLTFKISKTHPSGLLKSYQIDDVRDALRKVSPNIGREQ